MSHGQAKHREICAWRLFSAALSVVILMAAGIAALPAYAQTGVKAASGTTAVSAETGATAGSSTTSATGTKLQGGVSKSDLGIDLEGRYGVAVRKAEKLPFKAIVDNIRPGSMAYYSGLRAGDKILDAKGDKDKATVTFDRGGKVYSVSLAPLSPQLLVKPKGTKLDAASIPLAEKKKLIAGHDVVLIIDRTKSMDTPDCPGGTTRWNWCRQQALNFMQDMDGYLKDVTIITFNESFETHLHSPARKIGELLNSVKPDGNTNTVGPLRAVLNDYFQRRAAGTARPVLIAMITDGMPNLPDNPKIAKLEVQKEIVNAVAHMNNAGEITLTFLQVGTDFQGGQFLTDLSEHLGVPYDIVDTKTFADLQRLGLRDALVDALCTQKIYSVEAKIGAPSTKK